MKFSIKTWVFNVYLDKYGQYKKDIFTKLNFNFKSGKKMLDIGCGDGSDARIFINEYKLDTYGVDIYEHGGIKRVKGLKFNKAGIYDIPFKNDSFDYVFLHDMLHHVDEKHQDLRNHLKALRELKRVAKKNSFIIIIEGNRYNPLFYPHMVKRLGHNHWKQLYFIKTIRKVFSNVNFKFFEAHSYPRRLLWLFKMYEYLMELLSPKKFLAYNVAVISNE